MRLARRNGGISESEHTLYMFIIPTILAPFSLLLYGLGVTYNIHWFGLVFSQGCLAVVAALSVAGALGYAISSYPELSGDMVTTCILIRNTLSFAINYGLVVWPRSRRLWLTSFQHYPLGPKYGLPRHVHHGGMYRFCLECLICRLYSIRSKAPGEEC